MSLVPSRRSSSINRLARFSKIMSQESLKGYWSAMQYQWHTFNLILETLYCGPHHSSLTSYDVESNVLRVYIECTLCRDHACGTTRISVKMWYIFHHSRLDNVSLNHV